MKSELVFTQYTGAGFHVICARRSTRILDIGILEESWVGRLYFQVSTFLLRFLIVLEEKWAAESEERIGAMLTTSTAVVDLVQQLLRGGARLFVLRQVVWIGGHGEDFFDLLTRVVVASHLAVRFGQV